MSKFLIKIKYLQKADRQDGRRTASRTRGHPSTKIYIPQYRRERHLATAITMTEVNYMLTNLKNPAPLRPHHKRLADDLKGTQILPAEGFFSWRMKNLDDLHNHGKESLLLLKRAESVAHMATKKSYSHFYKTPPPPIAERPMPLDTIRQTILYMDKND